MSNFLHRHWVTACLERSGLASLVERYFREHEAGQTQSPAQALLSWKSLLHGSRLSLAYPGLVSVLALISAGTGLYPYGPVLVAAVVFAPERWRSTYLAATVGAAAGAMILAQVVQSVGGHLIGEYFPGLEHSEQWMRAEQWIKAYGIFALAAIAALPLPQMPSVLILALAKTSPSVMGVAILLGKLCKYGVYILGVRLILKSIGRSLEKGSTPK